ncbi:thiamine phosphate synthase [uncultured Vibrio sp.]|uniref:thiamine phosphate synthase n=1 Tax=uncultured Vibrio sp. TaxID=114054 RepID=UPI000917B224|nr:thiamine phosphate synthase [uncultured Vibrio sp.]OIQ25009.1 MAG: thiamine phosphate synthase [Vibrio sp. MedPE-SWchi]
MNVFIPAHSIELTGEVQQCLLVAKQQGFDIANIELGVSPTHNFSLHDNDTSFIISDAATSDEMASKADLVVSYLQTQTLLEVSENLVASANTVFIGVNADDGTYDAWRHNGANRALFVDSARTNDFEQPRHFAWLLTCLALDFPLEDSLVLARAACSVSRETWPSEFDIFPIPVLENSLLSIQVGWTVEGKRVAFPKLSKISLGLYPVVDSVEWIEKLLKMGIKTTQLRIKNPELENLEEQIERSIRLGEEYDAQVFINDYWQLAVKHGAFGVHLGQDDIEESNLTALSEANINIGLSTHGYYELLRIVQIEPSYIALGHIFPTTTKEMPSKPQGLVRLSLYQRLIDTIPYSSEERGFPTVAIGGIDQSTAPKVWDCGVSSLAVVRAITLSDSPQSVIEDFSNIMSTRISSNSIGQQELENA